MIEPVVEIDWVLEHRDQVRLADVRWYLDGRSGQDAFIQGHVPGAVFVDLDRWLADEPSPTRGRHPLPSPERFAEGMARCGFGDGDTVVAYDDQGGVIAARLVWLLRATQHDAAVLNGGIQVYRGPLATGAETPASAQFTARAWPEGRLADLDEAASRAHVVVDARDRARYRGDLEPVDARAGHIPGARSVPCRENLTDDGRFRSVDEIRRRFHEAGVESDSDVISYCGSGVTACHNLLALEYAGLGEGRLYPGSWSEYSGAPGRPLAVGDEPG